MTMNINRPKSKNKEKKGLKYLILFILLLGGLYWKKASRVGALGALLCGLTALLGLGPIKNAVGLSAFTGAHIGLFTIALTVIVMVVLSLLFPDTKQKVQL